MSTGKTNRKVLLYEEQLYRRNRLIYIYDYKGELSQTNKTFINHAFKYTAVHLISLKWICIWKKHFNSFILGLYFLNEIFESNITLIVPWSSKWLFKNIIGYYSPVWRTPKPSKTTKHSCNIKNTLHAILSAPV